MIGAVKTKELPGFFIRISAKMVRRCSPSWACRMICV